MRVMNPFPSFKPGSPFMLLTKYTSRAGSNTTASDDASPLLTTAIGALALAGWVALSAAGFDVHAWTTNSAATVIAGKQARNVNLIIFSPSSAGLSTPSPLPASRFLFPQSLVIMNNGAPSNS
jgi:hypothetical protein